MDIHFPSPAGMRRAHAVGIGHTEERVEMPGAGCRKRLE
jgi:hypothetical protein